MQMSVRKDNRFPYITFNFCEAVVDVIGNVFVSCPAEDEAVECIRELLSEDNKNAEI